MIYLGIDFGSKRIGVAISSSGVVAKELENCNSISQLSKIIIETNPDIIAIGIPKNAQGGLGTQAMLVKSQVQCLEEKLKDRCPTIKYVNEYLTSFEAEEQLRLQGIPLSKIKDLIDSRSAKIILEQYLNGRNNEK